MTSLHLSFQRVYPPCQHRATAGNILWAQRWKTFPTRVSPWPRLLARHFRGRLPRDQRFSRRQPCRVASRCPSRRTTQPRHRCRMRQSIVMKRQVGGDLCSRHIISRGRASTTPPVRVVGQVPSTTWCQCLRSRLQGQLWRRCIKELESALATYRVSPTCLRHQCWTVSMRVLLMGGWSIPGRN